MKKFLGSPDATSGQNFFMRFFQGSAWAVNGYGERPDKFMGALNKPKHKGILIWDFDGVLFETERYRLDNRKAFVKYGIPEEIILNVLDEMQRNKEHFSISRFIRGLRKKNISVSDKVIHAINDHNITNKGYYSPRVDALLHRMKKRGFIQMVVSKGSAPYQRKKMFVGCGIGFTRHFASLIVTPRNKHFTIAKIKKMYPAVPMIFIDDTKENLDLVKEHVPGVKTIHYSNVSGGSLSTLEKQILAYAKTYKKEKS